MPVRDEQEYEQKRQQIMQGALYAFAHKGFEKATNKDIAQEAKIGSPGLIYHYFKDKNDLLYRILEHYAPPLYLLTQNEKQLMNQPPQEVLYRFARGMVGMWDNRTSVALLKVILGEALRNPTVGEMVGQLGPGRAFTFFNRYFQRQIDLGVMRPMNTPAAVRCFIGPLIGYGLSREVLQVPDSADLDSETMVDTVVDIFLRGILVQESQHASAAAGSDDLK